MMRPVPPDFEARWPEVGWDGAEEYWHAHSRSIRRWLIHCGRDRLVAQRDAFVKEQRKLRARERRKRFRLP